MHGAVWFTMMPMVKRIALLLGLLCPLSAAAVELRAVKVRNGTAGLVHVPVTIANTGASAIACTAQLAHWYSAVVGSAAPGAQVRIDLWYETATGAYLVLNETLDNMPVEALWCGIAGRAYATRALLPLSRDAAAPQALACAEDDERLVCR